MATKVYQSALADSLTSAARMQQVRLLIPRMVALLIVHCRGNILITDGDWHEVPAVSGKKEPAEQWCICYFRGFNAPILA